MSRPRKPTRTLELAGAFERNPKRGKEREGEPDLPLGVGEPPAKFDTAQVECWEELAYKGKEWLTLGDAPVLEQAAKLLARDRRSDLDTADGKRLDKLLSDLGFGPVARTKVKAIKKDDAKKTLIA